jgi:ssDNA-binding Zn-finger/Zn-ribbon topoisomerase 1
MTDDPRKDLSCLIDELEAQIEKNIHTTDSVQSLRIMRESLFAVAKWANRYPELKMRAERLRSLARWLPRGGYKKSAKKKGKKEKIQPAASADRSDIETEEHDTEAIPKSTATGNGDG